MDVEVVQSGETYVLKLKGKWTIERVQELRDLLIEAMQGSGHVIVEMEEPLEVDLAYLQVLCSAHRSALKLGKQMVLHCKKSPGFGQEVSDAGFAQTLGCLQHPGDNRPRKGARKS
jgi:anti-anti-sigma regulatory factor